MKRKRKKATPMSAPEAERFLLAFVGGLSPHADPVPLVNDGEAKMYRATFERFKQEFLRANPEHGAAMWW